MAIGKVFHLIHMTGDFAALEAWYDDVFDVRRGFLDNHYMEVEKRDASFVTIADCVIETLAPAFRVEGWDDLPIGKSYKRFGNHWHSIAWYTDNVGEMWERCVAAGIRTFAFGGGAVSQPPAFAFLTHPRDTVIQLEFAERIGPVIEYDDPRFMPGWDPRWWATDHPLGLERMAYTSVVTRDLERAKAVFVDVLGGALLYENDSPLTGTRNAYVAMGESIVELALPTRAGTVAALDLEANGEIHHAVAFRVRDLEAAEKYLAGKGVAVIDRDATTLVMDPATTHGAPFRFTTWDVPRRPAHVSYAKIQS